MNFLDALSEARRRAILSGKPLTNQEIQGMQQGYFSGEAQLSNQKRAEMIREKQAQENLQLQKEQEQAQLDAAKQASINQTIGNVANTGVSYLGADYMKSGPGESLISKGYTGVKNYFGGSGENFAADTGANVAGDATLIAPETVEAAAPAATQGAGGAVLAEGGGSVATEGAGTAGGATLGSVLPIVGLAATAAKIGGTLGEQWGRHSLGLAESNTGMQFARTLQHPWEVSHWGDEISPNMGSKARAVKDVLDPVGFLTEKAGCIIVTACTSKDSPEVEITREYRDKFMTPDQLRGYYMIAEKVVPILNRSSIIKYLVKKILVDSLIEYGAYVLGKTKIIPSLTSCLITDWFMNKCELKGKTVKSFTRSNGEVF